MDSLHTEIKIEYLFYLIIKPNMVTKKYKWDDLTKKKFDRKKDWSWYEKWENPWKRKK
jgi:hypothetical protein